MKRLMKERGINSTGGLRLAMAERGIKIGQGTLHNAREGNVQISSRLETLEKIAQFFEITPDQLLQLQDMDDSYWPFSEELQAKVLKLEAHDLNHLENVMRAHLRMPSLHESSVEGEQQQPQEHLLHEPAVGYGVSQGEGSRKRYRGLEDAALPADGNASTQSRRSTPSQGGGRGR